LTSCNGGRSWGKYVFNTNTMHACINTSRYLDLLHKHHLFIYMAVCFLFRRLKTIYINCIFGINSGRPFIEKKTWGLIYIYGAACHRSLNGTIFQIRCFNGLTVYELPLANTCHCNYKRRILFYYWIIAPLILGVEHNYFFTPYSSKS